MPALLSFLYQALLSFWSCIIHVVTQPFRQHQQHQGQSQESPKAESTENQLASALTSAVPLPPFQTVSISAPLPSPVGCSVVFPSNSPQNSSQFGIDSSTRNEALHALLPDQNNALPQPTHATHFGDFFYHEEISPSSQLGVLRRESKPRPYTGSIHKNYRHRNRRKAHDLVLPSPLPLSPLPETGTSSLASTSSVTVSSSVNALGQGPDVSLAQTDSPTTENVSHYSSPSLYPPTPSFTFSPQACSSPPFGRMSPLSPITPDQPGVPVLGFVTLYNASQTAPTLLASNAQKEDTTSRVSLPKAIACPALEPLPPRPILVDEVLEGHEATVQIPMPIPEGLIVPPSISPATSTSSVWTGSGVEFDFSPDALPPQSDENGHENEEESGADESNADDIIESVGESQSEDGYWDEFGQWQRGFYLSPMEVYNPRRHYAEKYKPGDSDDEVDWSSEDDDDDNRTGPSSGLGSVDTRRGDRAEYKEVLRVTVTAEEDEAFSDEDVFAGDGEFGFDEDGRNGATSGNGMCWGRNGSRTQRGDTSADSFFAGVRYGVVFDRERFGLRGNGDEDVMAIRGSMSWSTVFDRPDFDDDDDDDDEQGSLGISDDMDGAVDEDQGFENPKGSIQGSNTAHKGKGREGQPELECTRDSVAAPSEAGSDESLYPSSNEAMYRGSVSSRLSNPTPHAFGSLPGTPIPAECGDPWYGHSEQTRRSIKSNQSFALDGQTEMNSSSISNISNSEVASSEAIFEERISDSSSCSSSPTANRIDIEQNAPDLDAYSQLRPLLPYTPVKRNASGRNEYDDHNTDDYTRTPTLVLQRLDFLNPLISSPTPRTYSAANSLSHFARNSFPPFNIRGYNLTGETTDFKELLSGIRPSRSEIRISFNSVKAESRVSIVEAEIRHETAEMEAIIVSNGFDDGWCATKAKAITPLRVQPTMVGQRIIQSAYVAPSMLPPSLSSPSPIFSSRCSSIALESSLPLTPVSDSAATPPDDGAPQRPHGNVNGKVDEGPQPSNRDFSPLGLTMKGNAPRKLGHAVGGIEGDEMMDLWPTSILEGKTKLHGREIVENTQPPCGEAMSYGAEDDDLFSISPRLLHPKAGETTRDSTCLESSWISSSIDSSSHRPRPFSPPDYFPATSPSSSKHDDTFPPLRSMWSESSGGASPPSKLFTGAGATSATIAAASRLWFRRGNRSTSVSQLTAKQGDQQRKAYQWRQALSPLPNSRRRSGSNFSLVDKLFAGSRGVPSPGVKLLNSSVFKRLRSTEPHVGVDTGEANEGESPGMSERGDLQSQVANQLQSMDEVLDISRETNHVCDESQQENSEASDCSSPSSSTDTPESSLPPSTPIQQTKEYIRLQNCPPRIEKCTTKSTHVGDMTPETPCPGDFDTNLVSPLDALAAEIRRRSADLEQLRSLHLSPVVAHKRAWSECTVSGWSSDDEKKTERVETLGHEEDSATSARSACSESDSESLGQAIGHACVYEEHQVVASPTMSKQEQRRSRAVDDILALLDSSQEAGHSGGDCTIAPKVTEDPKRNAVVDGGRKDSHARVQSDEVVGTDEDIPLSLLKTRECYAI